MALSRRDALLLGSGLTAGAVGAGWLARRASAPIVPEAEAHSLRSEAARYGHGVAPPAEIGPLGRDAATIPPPPYPATGPATRELALEVLNQAVPVAADRRFDAWTFGGSLPGPILRANEGDTLAITLRNLGTDPHNLHFHGRHQVGSDGWEPVRPGAEARYTVSAAPFGVHPYHCDLTPERDHIANGLYGALIVDPPGGRPPAHELVLVLGGFDTDGDGRSDLFGWNGMAGFYAKYALKVPVGERVRLYVLNMLMDEPVASFHLHAETFDVFRSGTSLTPDEHTDVVTLGPAERAILEFTLPDRGRYMFHPHQRKLAEGGAMGWLAAV